MTLERRLGRASGDSSLTPRTPNCGSAKRWCIGIGESPSKPSNPGGESWACIVRTSFAASTRASTVISTRRNLAALANERGDQAEAERLWHDVLAECPGDREA